MTNLWKQLALPGGPVLALLATLIFYAGNHQAATAITLGVTVLCIIWWVFEPIPIPATSLVPLAVLPMAGILTSTQVSQAYGHPLILLLLGGFLLATALEKNGAHRRIALTMVKAFGGHSSRHLVFGFMAAAGLLSMWISNTATTLMMLPVAMAIIERSEDPKLTTPLLLGIAYGASIGGMGTPIGTPPNVIFMGVYSEMVGTQLSFADWMKWGVPTVLVMLPLAGIWLTRHLGDSGSVELPEVGPFTSSERRVLWVFVITALAWITRSEPFGGWSSWLHLPYTNDAIVAFLAVLALFIIPSGRIPGERLLDWETAARIPWGMLILFGAGITLAEGFRSSGLSETIGASLAGIGSLPLLLMLMVICLTVTFLTEATSNTATTTLLMPILAAGALGAGLDPRLLMVPAAMSASCAFMLPVATAPNVIMFSTGRFSVRTMAREGVALNLIGVVVISTVCYLLIR